MTATAHASRRTATMRGIRFGELLLRTLAAMLPPRCARCGGTQAVALHTTTPRPRLTPCRERSIAAGVTGATAFLRDAILVSQGHRHPLCAPCKAPPCAYRNSLCHAANAAHHALRAMLGDHCAACGATADLVLDQLTPPPYRLRTRNPGRDRIRPSGVHLSLYYAALARGGRLQVLCRSCNAHRPAEHPGWCATVQARARIQ